MIDLGADVSAGGACLRQSLVVGGAEVPVDTSFRAWIRFGRVLAEEGVADPRVLRGPAPEGWATEAVAFLEDRQELPRGSRAGRRVLDVDADAALITAAFLQAYGIDLTDPATDMHWHLFLALLRSVPSDTMLAQVMAWRSWEPGRRSAETEARERLAAWSLPSVTGRDRDEAVAYQLRWFGDAWGEGRG